MILKIYFISISLLLGGLTISLRTAEPISKDGGKSSIVNFDDIPSPSHNLQSKAGTELGKKLFFDPRLSGNNTIACATCHKPQYAFADTAQFSLGINGKHTQRNAMSLCNLAWQPFYFWNGREKNLEDLILSPLINANEMGQDTTELLQELSADTQYPDLFEAAFQTPLIGMKHVQYALSQYLRSLTSQNAPIEKMIVDSKQLKTDNDRQLVKIMMPFASDKVVETTFLCLKCHTDEHMFGGLLLKNDGLDTLSDADTIASQRAQPAKGNFKVPSLRNIALTAPYMHDGRFRTLAEVIEHYNSGIKANPKLSPELKDEQGQPTKLGLSKAEKKQMLQFLDLFTDTTFIQSNLP